jgi:hypothetical protein
VTLAAVVLAVSMAQSPLAGAPRDLALPGYKVHLIVSEDLNPDALRGLARPNTVLWMQTRSNMLRVSSVENLARFPEAYVFIRPPVLDLHAQQLKRAPAAGLWVREQDLATPGLYRFGGRPLAIDVEGELSEERASNVTRAKPRRITWSPSTLDMMSWSRFAQLPGAKLIQAAEEGAVVAALNACRCTKGLKRIALRLDGRTWKTGERTLPPDGIGARVRISSAPSDRLLSWIFAKNPTVELELEIGTNEDAAEEAAQLLRRLEQGTSLPAAKAQ